MNAQAEVIRQELPSALITVIIVKTTIGGILLMAFFASIWSLANFFIPDGWWQVIPNIGMLVLTAAAAIAIKNSLALALPKWASWVASLTIWGIAGLYLRSIELSVLAEIF